MSKIKEKWALVKKWESEGGLAELWLCVIFGFLPAVGMIGDFIIEHVLK